MTFYNIFQSIYYQKLHILARINGPSKESGSYNFSFITRLCWSPELQRVTIGTKGVGREKHAETYICGGDLVYEQIDIIFEHTLPESACELRFNKEQTEKPVKEPDKVRHKSYLKTLALHSCKI